MDNKNVLIILAHPETKSFTSSMAGECEKYFKSRNCQVTIRDLYGLNFNPVAGPGDFTKLSDKGKEHFQLRVEQKEGLSSGTIKDDIKTEIEFVEKADLILFVFPLWWSSCPAIMKGYMERVLMHGFAYDYETNSVLNYGLLKGKQVKLLITTGRSEDMYSPQGPHKMSVEERIEHLTYGTLAFCGLNVYKTFIAHGVHHEIPKEKLQSILEDLKKDLAGIDNEKMLYQMS